MRKDLNKITLALMFAFMGLMTVYTTSIAQAQQISFPADHVVRVGVSEIPPFVMKGDDGNWTGITFQLWDQIAKNLNLQYNIYEYPHEQLYGALSQEKVDVALFIDPTRGHDYLLDYSKTYFHSELAIAGRADQESSMGRILSVLSSPEVVTIALILLVVVLIVSAIFWLLEKHNNPTLYDKEHGRGNFMNGVMWAILLVTAQEPDIFKNTSFWGRVIALVLLFVGVTVSASYVALITSSLTVNQLTASTHDKEDLPFIKVAALHDSRAGEYLSDHYIKYMPVETIADALDALEQNEIDGVLADGAELEFHVKSKGSTKIAIAPANIETEYYHLSYPEDSKLRKYIDPALTKFVETAEWPAILRRFLGHGTSHNL